MKRKNFILAAVVGLLLFSGCISARKETQWGHYLYSFGYKQNPEVIFLEDEELTGEVERIGNQLKQVSKCPEADIHYSIVNNSDVNAFSFPGYIFVNEGLLRTLQNRDELAAVLAHEIGHICDRDLKKEIYRQRSAQAGSILVNLLAVVGNVYVRKTLASPYGYNSRDLGEAAQLAISKLGISLISEIYMGFSDGDEIEADLMARDNLKKTTFNPNALVSVLERLDGEIGRLTGSANQGGSGSPDKAKSHWVPEPDTLWKRIDRLKGLQD